MYITVLVFSKTEVKIVLKSVVDGALVRCILNKMAGREKTGLHSLQDPQEMKLSTNGWVEDVGKGMKQKVGRECQGLKDYPC